MRHGSAAEAGKWYRGDRALERLGARAESALVLHRVQGLAMSLGHDESLKAPQVDFEM